MLAAIQQLRYEVYCLERHFIDPARFPDKREFDEYDPTSVHFATRDARGGIVGTLRLVLDSPLGFPMEAHAPHLFLGFGTVERSKVAEISRLIVTRADRRFERGETLRRHHRVLLPLFRDMYRKSLALDLEHWLAAMEPALHRLLETVMGLSFRPAGEPMDYYGQVVPYVAEIREMERSLERQRPALFAYFQDATNQP
jgi:N-acyl amino acid synthase of PEP-CTERM/exosortase system